MRETDRLSARGLAGPRASRSRLVRADSRRDDVGLPCSSGPRRGHVPSASVAHRRGRSPRHGAAQVLQPLLFGRPVRRPAHSQPLLVGRDPRLDQLGDSPRRHGVGHPGMAGLAESPRRPARQLAGLRRRDRVPQRWRLVHGGRVRQLLARPDRPTRLPCGVGSGHTWARTLHQTARLRGAGSVAGNGQMEPATGAGCGKSIAPGTSPFRPSLSSVRTTHGEDG
jgi:hypothetical protein